MNISRNTLLLKQEAYRLGFDFCGVSRAGFLEDEAPRLEKWLSLNMNGEMKYLEAFFDKRLNPKMVVDGARSVISLLLNYYPAERQKDVSAPKISKYAFGNDYHPVIKKKLESLAGFLSENFGKVNTGCFVDSGPVMEKAWAAKCGLGWVGKNGLLVSRKQGSFFFIAEIITDMEFEYDSPSPDNCGSCSACVAACPTGAISTPYVVDAGKCISYFTVEAKNSIPFEMKGKFENWAFGCDICQDVCPMNCFSKPTKEPFFIPGKKFLEMSKEDWYAISEGSFNDLFSNSSLKRAKFSGIKRNLEFLK